MAAPTIVDLPENLTIAHAELLHEQLDAYTSESAGVILNAAAVVRADTAGLQLIYAFMQALRQHGAPCSWTAVPPVLVDAAAGLGLRDQLNLL